MSKEFNRMLEDLEKILEKYQHQPKEDKPEWKVSDIAVFNYADKKHSGTITAINHFIKTAIVCYFDEQKTKYIEIALDKLSKPKEELKEPDRIEVMDFEIDREEKWLRFHFNMLPLVVKQDYDKIKQAIENCLNGKEVYHDWQFRYTQEQVDKMMEDMADATWYAAREKVILDRNPANKQYRYLSFDQWYSSIKDYKNQLNK